jgi:hypothetical protein
MSLVSDIKLIRTDTTLDLSQKAEKGILLLSSTSHYIPTSSPLLTIQNVWGNEVHTLVSLKLMKHSVLLESDVDCSSQTLIMLYQAGT